MQDVLVVVDMQNDFVSGTLGTKEAMDIVPLVTKRVVQFKGKIVFTRDTHESNYLQTREGKMLPVEHCIKGSHGWELIPELSDLAEIIVDKGSFGSIELGKLLAHANQEEVINRIFLIGVCTDVCVISNAIILQAFLPNAEIIVDASCCAGSNPENHKCALKSMNQCQIKIIDEKGLM